MPKVTFMPSGQTVEVAEGTAVLDAALENNILIDHNCGGNCACSTCHIVLDSGFEGHDQMTEDEEDMLDEADGVTKTSRLACQCKIKGDLVVTIPEKDSEWDDE